jgi:hypothetical protein
MSDLEIATKIALPATGYLDGEAIAIFQGRNAQD